MVSLVANCVYDTSGEYIRRVAEGEHDQTRKATHLRGSGNLKHFFPFVCLSVNARICFCMAVTLFYLDGVHAFPEIPAHCLFILTKFSTVSHRRTHRALHFNGQHNIRFLNIRYKIAIQSTFSLHRHDPSYTT
jgi:hypothetical protein